MDNEKALNYRHWYMDEVANIIGDEAMTDFIVMDPIRFLNNAPDEGDVYKFNIEGFLNYRNIIIPLIVIWDTADSRIDGYDSENTALYATHCCALNGYIVVGKYIWDAYHKMKITQKESFLNNFYPLIAQCIDDEFFETRGDEFAVAHCGFKAYKKALFALEDIRCKYYNRKENLCQKTKKFGDRLLPLENIAQRCPSKIYYYDFGCIYFRKEPSVVIECDESDFDETEE